MLAKHSKYDSSKRKSLALVNKISKCKTFILLANASVKKNDKDYLKEDI